MKRPAKNDIQVIWRVPETPVSEAEVAEGRERVESALLEIARLLARQAARDDHEMMNYLMAACRRFDEVDEAATGWIAPIVTLGLAKGLGIDAIARDVRGLRDPVIAEHAEAALTEKGQDDPVGSYRRLVHHAWAARTRDQKMVEHRQHPTWPLRFSAVLDGDTCSAGRGMHEQQFNLADVPALPLAGCDAEVCRCFFMQARPRRKR